MANGLCWSCASWVPASLKADHNKSMTLLWVGRNCAKHCWGDGAIWKQLLSMWAVRCSCISNSPSISLFCGFSAEIIATPGPSWSCPAECVTGCLHHRPSQSLCIGYQIPADGKWPALSSKAIPPTAACLNCLSALSLMNFLETCLLPWGCSQGRFNGFHSSTVAAR